MDDDLSAAERQMIVILREWAGIRERTGSQSSTRTEGMRLNTLYPTTAEGQRAASDERSRKRGATWRRRGREKKRRWPRARLTINDASAARKRTMPRVPPIIDSRKKIVD